jgi:hypothetical protein
MVLDMIRLYALKYRMQHASKQWLGAFCACGGVSVLVENMDNALEIYPLTDVNANALYELMLCMRVVVESEGLAMVLETRGAIDVFAMCFHVDHKLLALEVLNMLCVVCFKGGSTAVWEVEFGIQHLAKAHRQKPFETFKNAIGNPSVDYSVKVAIISFINNLFLGNEKIGTRIKHRFLLETIGFLDLCTSVNEQMKESNSKLLLQQSSHTHGNNGSSGNGSNSRGVDSPVPVTASAPRPLRSILGQKSFHSPSISTPSPGATNTNTNTNANGKKPSVNVQVVESTQTSTAGKQLSGVNATAFLSSPRAVTGDTWVIAFEDACAQFSSLKGEFSTSEPQRVFVQLKNYVLSYWELEDSDDTYKDKDKDKDGANANANANASSKQRQPPPDAPNVVCAVASVKCVEYYSTHPDIQNKYDSVLRIELADGSKIHCGFESYEQMDFWASCLLESIDNVKMKLYSINDPSDRRRDANTSVRELCEIQVAFDKQIQIFKNCEGADMMLIEEDPRMALNDTLKLVDFIELELILHAEGTSCRKKFKKLLFCIANNIRVHKCASDEYYWNSLIDKCEELSVQLEEDSCGFVDAKPRPSADNKPDTGRSPQTSARLGAAGSNAGGNSGRGSLTVNEANVKIAELGKDAINSWNCIQL